MIITNTKLILSCIVVAALTGCASTPHSPLTYTQSPANQETAPQGKTSDLAGGSESANRTGQPIHKTVGKAFKGELFYLGPSSMKQVALTFDDGPDVEFTNQILSILKKNGIKATFFIIGTRAKDHPEMVRRIADEGHAIGNHTWNHPKMIKLNDAEIKVEVEQTNSILQSLIGYKPTIFRPPYGLADHRVIQDIANLNMKVIDWSVDTRDWAGTPTPKIMDFVKKEVTPGGIILEHCAGGKNDNLSNTVMALPEIISYLRKQGYSFKTIPELLGIPGRM